MLSLLLAGQLTNYTLAEDSEIIQTNQEVLGSEVIRMIPDDPRMTSILKPRYVTIHHMDKTYTGVTYAITVAEAIDDFDLELTPNSVIRPQEDLILGIRTTIWVDEVVRERHVEYAYIEYETIEQDDDTVEWGVKSIVQPGVTGQKKLTWEYLYLNNVYKGKDLISEEIIVEPQNEIVSVGTKKVFREMTINGDSFSYWRVMEGMHATSYDATCEGCSTRTATGKTLTKGIVAVDPTVIPLGTKLYIPGYGFAAAEDVGGSIKGNRIDLGFDLIENWYGKVSYGKYVDVYFLN